MSSAELPHSEDLSTDGALKAFSPGELGQRLAGWTEVSSARSAAKFLAYFTAVAFFITAILSLKGWLPVLLCQILLGLVYAHGLELTHECLHDGMFRSSRLNRLFGFVAGLPMLVSFTHYKYQHLHHHRYVGTDKDKELFDYKEESLRNPFRFFARAANLSRIPAFFAVLLRILRGIYPETFVSTGRSGAERRSQLFVEYLVMAALFATALVLTVTQYTNAFLLAWFIPWLVFGEIFHFLIELPEHLGRDRTQKNIYVNSRSYSCNSVWRYLVNGNNYHVEHHLYPRVAIRYLGLLNAELDAQARHTAPSYLSSVKQVFAKNEKTDLAPRPAAA